MADVITDVGLVLCSIWVGLSGLWCIILPLWESRQEMWIICRGVAQILSSKASGDHRSKV